jgi:putative DNA-invertase from lambdoid prophage Rac
MILTGCSETARSQRRKDSALSGRAASLQPARITPRRRAALFYRVSTEEQTAENQRPDVEGLARARDLNVVATYEETISGAKLERTKLAAMLDAAHRRAFDVVIVWALDRLGRTMFETIETVRKLDRAGVELLSVREPWLDMGGPARTLLLSIFAWVAEQERTRLIERTRAGMERAKRAGKIIGRPERAIRWTTVRALRADGLSIRAIARRIDVPLSTLHRAWQRREASRKGHPQKGAGTP